MAKQHIVDIKTSKFGFKYEKYSNAMKSGTQSWSSLLIINVIFEIADLDPKFKTLTECHKMVKMLDGQL